MPARATGRYVLDLEVQPTPCPPPQAELEEALMAFQLTGAQQARLEDVLAALLVALNKHLKRNGRYLAIELDEDTVLDDAEVLTPPSGPTG